MSSVYLCFYIFYFFIILSENDFFKQIFYFNEFSVSLFLLFIYFNSYLRMIFLFFYFNEFLFIIIVIIIIIMMMIIIIILNSLT